MRLTAIACCGMLLSLLLAGQATAESQIVPDVLGLSKLSAGWELRQKGFKVHPGYADSCEFPRGVISRQQPRAGTEARSGTVVIILENQTGGFKMPNLIGLSLEEAQRIATERGLTVGVDESQVRTVGETCDNPSSSWTAIETQSPASGTDVCLQGTKSVSLSRTKIVQKHLPWRRCEPRILPGCRHGECN